MKLRVRSRVIAGLFAAVLSVGSMAPGLAKAEEAQEEVIEKGPGAELESAAVKEVKVNYTVKKNNSKLKNVMDTVSSGKITAQLKERADGTILLHYTKDGGKTFTKINFEKIIRQKLGLSEETAFTVYDAAFLGEIFTVTGYYFDESEKIHFFALASRNMKTFYRKKLPDIKEGGNSVPHLSKMGNQYIWYVSQNYENLEDPEAVLAYKYVYYAGEKMTALKRKEVKIDSPLTQTNLGAVSISAQVNENTGMALIYSGYDNNGFNLVASELVMTKDGKNWSRPVSLIGEDSWSWRCSMTDGGFVTMTKGDVPAPEGADYESSGEELLSIRAYDGTGKKIGFYAAYNKDGFLDVEDTFAVTEKNGEIVYVTIETTTSYSSYNPKTGVGSGGAVPTAVRVAKDGTMEKRKLPFDYETGIQVVASDTKKGVRFVMDNEGTVYMSKDGMISFVTFKAPENGEGILDFNVVGDYLIFESAQNSYKVKLTTLYKNFK